MKTNRSNRMTKVMAGTLAVLMMMTTASSLAVSADEAPVTAPSSYNLTENDAIGLATDVLFTGIEENVPGGKMMLPFIKIFANELMGKGKELTFDDINEKLDELFKKSEELSEKIINSTKQITAIQNFTNCQYITINSQIHEILTQIQEIKDNDNLTIEQKLAQIGGLIGNNSDWTKNSDSAIVNFRSFVYAVNKPSVNNSDSIFKTIYNFNKQYAMFSGEALDMSAEANELIMTDCYAGYLVLIECLNAQRQVAMMSEDQRAKIDPQDLANNTSAANLKTITNRMEELTEMVFGKPVEKTGFHQTDDGILVYGTYTEYDDSGVVGKYKTINKTYRRIFLNKGTGVEVELNANLTVTNTNTIKTYECSRFEEGVYKPVREMKADFNNKIYPKMTLNGDQIKAIAEFARSKGVTLREYLKMNGFNTDSLPSHALFVLDEAYDNKFSATEILKGAVACSCFRTFLKVIDIDLKSPAEEEVFIMESGEYNIFYGYLYRYDKNIVTFNKGAAIVATAAMPKIEVKI